LACGFKIFVDHGLITTPGMIFILGLAALEGFLGALLVGPAVHKKINGLENAFDHIMDVFNQNHNKELLPIPNRSK
jgi:hypothetical protein